MPKDGRIVRSSLESLPKGQTDWQRVDQLTDEEIETAIRQDPDAAPIGNEQWFERAQLVIPAHLKHLWVQIDEDLMAWFRQQGEDWPVKINAALREYVEARRKRRKRGRLTIPFRTSRRSERRQGAAGPAELTALPSMHIGA